MTRYYSTARCLAQKKFVYPWIKRNAKFVYPMDKAERELSLAVRGNNDSSLRTVHYVHYEYSASASRLTWKTNYDSLPLAFSKGKILPRVKV